MRLTRTVVIGWVICLAGTAVWFYGYFATGTPSLIDWHAFVPWWLSDLLPNKESEIGMALVLVAMVPIYWPVRRQ